MLLNVPNEIFVDTDRADIKPEFRSALDRVATVLNENTISKLVQLRSACCSLGRLLEH